MNIEANRPIGDLVAEHPEFGTVFEQLGIDYCCGGKRSLAEACRQKELTVEELLSKLESSPYATPNAKGEDPAKMSLADLASHIIETHHAYLRRVLPQLIPMVERVANKHGEHNPGLTKLPSIMAAFSTEIMSHLDERGADAVSGHWSAGAIVDDDPVFPSGRWPIRSVRWRRSTTAPERRSSSFGR